MKSLDAIAMLGNITECKKIQTIMKVKSNEMEEAVPK